MSELPTKGAILDWIRENPDAATKRDIARAFGVRGADRVALKRMLRDLMDDGEIKRSRKKLRPSGTLPPVTVIEVTGTDADGEPVARPVKWEDEGEPPAILVLPRKQDPAFGPGDRVLAKITATAGDKQPYQARPIKKIGSGARRMIGIFRGSAQGGRIEPVSKRASREWTIPRGKTGDAQDGELVEAAELGGTLHGLPKASITERFGDPSGPRQVSLIAMIDHDIPHDFPEAVLEEAAAARPVSGLGDRTDLRDLPLLTIDPVDARDHDDAVYAHPVDDPANPGGHAVWVAIADVAHYVRPGSALDREARLRGNSTYFPDRVSPMLPEELSADLCSLHEGEDRPCIAVRMVLDAEGNKIAHRFERAMTRSAASLAYEDAQAAVDGATGSEAAKRMSEPLAHLFAAYRAAAAARDRRQPLDLDLPERRIDLAEDGTVRGISYRERLDAHRLIEEFMILANVCAAETLEAARQPLLYRVHEEPAPERLDSLRETLKELDLTLAKGQVLKTAHLNRLLEQARGQEFAETVSMSVLRSQMQAYYSPENLAHFGLNLRRYAHFTSPIRRYADLIVHRALIAAMKAGDDGLAPADIETLTETAEHISMTERRSMEAERDTVDRYVAAFMADRVGGEFKGVISGVSRAGIFVRLDETGADGLIPISTLGSDYFHHDRDRGVLVGEKTGREFGLGLKVTARLVEAAPVSGGLILELREVEGKAMTLRKPRKGRSAAKRGRKFSRPTRARNSR